VQISLYVRLLATASKYFNKRAFFEKRGIMRWSIILCTDWFNQRFLQV